MKKQYVHPEMDVRRLLVLEQLATTLSGDNEVNGSGDLGTGVENDGSVGV